jgi:hypothetical protein
LALPVVRAGQVDRAGPMVRGVAAAGMAPAATARAAPIGAGRAVLAQMTGDPMTTAPAAPEDRGGAGGRTSGVPFRNPSQSRNTNSLLLISTRA